MIINEQIRRYNEKMEEIEQLEYAEALAVNQLKLKRQNTVRDETRPRSGLPLFDLVWPQYHGNDTTLEIVVQPQQGATIKSHFPASLKAAVSDTVVRRLHG